MSSLECVLKINKHKLSIIKKYIFFFNVNEMRLCENAFELALIMSQRVVETLFLGSEAPGLVF